MKFFFNDVVIEMLDHALQLIGLLRFAEDAEVSDKEKEICLPRLDAAYEHFMKLDLKSEESSPEEKSS